MKTHIKNAIETGSVAEAHYADGFSLAWVCIPALLSYFASILVTLAADPLIRPVVALAIATASPSAHSTPPQSWFKRMFYRPSWTEVVERCESPKAICDLVGSCVSYRTEDVDYWRSAEETWQRGRGDCKDFAVCIENLCHQRGFNATIHVYFPSDRPEEGHAVVVGNWKDQMWMSSNGSFEVVRSIDDVKESVSHLYDCRKNEMWGAVFTHAAVERHIHESHTLSVASPQD